MSQVRARKPRVAVKRPSRTISLEVLRDRTGLRVGPDAFWRLYALNPDLRLERIARGESIAIPSAGSWTGLRNGDLGLQVATWSKADGRGHYFDSSAGFTLPDGAIRGPDAAWILRERWEAVPLALRERFAPACPDFVVELTSPSDKKNLGSLRRKMRDYLVNGSRLGWLLDPRSGLAEIYRPGRDVESLIRPTTLSGEDVLPGFVLDLRGILFD